MKNFKKKLVALGLGIATMASSAMSMSASAFNPFLQYDAWPAYYVPYAGTCYASVSQVRVDGVKWSAAQLQQIAAEGNSISMELEFRPYYESASGEMKPAKTHGIWSGKNGGLVTNIPGASFEFQFVLIDNDDVTIVIPGIAENITADKSYFAGQPMVQLTGVSNNDLSYLFECELGAYGGADSFPGRCSQRSTYIPFGITKSIRE